MAEEPIPAPLVEVLRQEQRARWQAGERIPVEAYLERHPALQADVEGVLELLYHEVLLREGLGETPQLEEYRARFPQWADRLRLLFEVHRAYQAGPLLDGSGAGTLPHGITPPATGELPAVPGYEL